ncbi:hypothetical protein L6164_032127 [Bauhinia variegata]|uniref:Uncharacterized protein n=1 Tax=Bauhinia variegata TaxID=167791 RepID=A0ACB9KMV5_BAUVA|nr:hypothetical protein L6164_032127 [Bauhinia variegata]
MWLVEAYHLKCVRALLSLILPLALSGSARLQPKPLLSRAYLGTSGSESHFIESGEQPADDPLLLCLGGGPGCSALSALLYQIGPLSFNYNKSREGHKPVLELNHYSWTKVANIIFSDSPAGTGFSYSQNSERCNTSDKKSVELAYEFLRKDLLFQPLSRKLRKVSDADRGIAGIKLGGYILGNPFTDVKYDINSRVNFAHRFALIDDEIYEAAEVYCSGEYVHPNTSDSECTVYLKIIDLCLKDIYSPMILEPTCSISSLQLGPKILEWPLGVNPSEDLLSDFNPWEKLWCRNYYYLFVNVWANDKAVQEALHVRNVLSSLPYHRNFTNDDLRALIYSGDHDLIIPFLGTYEWIQSLNLSVSTDDEWRPWFVDGQIGGFMELYKEKKYGITFSTVQGAGHTAPEYKPKETCEMIRRWLAYYFV